jgi:hypothetical protein
MSNSNNLLLSRLSGDINEDAKRLVSNFLASDEQARKNLLLIADAYAKQYPNKGTPLRLFPVKWRPTLLRFFVFR